MQTHNAQASSASLRVSTLKQGTVDSLPFVIDLPVAFGLHAVRISWPSAWMLLTGWKRFGHNWVHRIYTFIFE